MIRRRYCALDRILIEGERALEAIFVASPSTREPSPAAAIADPPFGDAERRHAAGLMRINHVGEVCAQALYFGQASVARDTDLRSHLLEAAAEENDHLGWCGQRLHELGSRPSLFNPFWYAGAWLIGAGAGLVGDRLSLGFVVETERQVEAHLGEHLQLLPPGDLRSRAILTRMQADEARHAQAACAKGATELPPPLPALMRLASAFMKKVAYRL